MEVNRLSYDELEYELKIRGYGTALVNRDENIMRNLLRGLLKSNSNATETFVVLDPQEEITVCTAKLRHYSSIVDAVYGNKSSDSYRTADTKLSHLLARIDRITTTDEQLTKARSVLLKAILHLMRQLETKAQCSGALVDPSGPNVDYNIMPVSRTLIVSSNKMSTNVSNDLNCVRKDEETGTEIFSHQGVALKKLNAEHRVDPVAGTISIVQYKEGKSIEWKPTDVSFESENTDCEWDVVDTVRHRTVSTSSNADNYHMHIQIPMSELRSYKIKQSSRQISLITANRARYSFLFQCGNSDSFISALRAILNTRRSGRSKNTYTVCGEREESKLVKSFNDLSILADPSEQPNVWNFMRSLQTRPYETTMQTFSKLTDTLLYRTPEQRPVDAEVAELLTQSFHVEGNDKSLESDYTIVEEAKNVNLCPRPVVVRGEPLNGEVWKSCIDSEGRVTDPDKVKRIIFKGGIVPELRYCVWKYLLNYYPWSYSYEELRKLEEQKVLEYCGMKRQWQTMNKGQERRFSGYRDRKNLIEKDVYRTDRMLPYYAGENNPNVQMLNDILMTYVMYNFDLGYVQGMSDLLSPILYLMTNEEVSFWCFVGFMDRVYRNFDLDQSGMKKQLALLYSLLQVVAPDLANYLNKHDSHNMFFCFRWLLVHFKREFSLDDIMTLWEVIWTNLPCPNFHLLICIAVLDLEKDGLMKDGNGFTEILKHVNELSCRMDLQKVLTHAESIYEQLKASGENVPVNVRQIIGLADSQENDSENSDEESSFVNTTLANETAATTPTAPKWDDNDSIIDDIERVTLTPEPAEAGFERAITTNYY